MLLARCKTKQLMASVKAQDCRQSAGLVTFDKSEGNVEAAVVLSIRQRAADEHKLHVRIGAHQRRRSHVAAERAKLSANVVQQNVHRNNIHFIATEKQRQHHFTRRTTRQSSSVRIRGPDYDPDHSQQLTNSACPQAIDRYYFHRNPFATVWAIPISLTYTHTHTHTHTDSIAQPCQRKQTVT